MVPWVIYASELVSDRSHRGEINKRNQQTSTGVGITCVSTWGQEQNPGTAALSRVVEKMPPKKMQQLRPPRIALDIAVGDWVYSRLLRLHAEVVSLLQLEA